MKKTKLPTKYLTKIRKILKAENFSDEQINVMTDRYLAYDDKDRNLMMENDQDDFHVFLDRLPKKVEDRMVAIKKDPYLKNNFSSMTKILKRANITLGQAKSLCAYSYYDNTEILSMKRNASSKEVYLNRITNFLKVELQIKERYSSFAQVDKKFGSTIEFVKGLNPFSEKSKNLINSYLEEKNLKVYKKLFVEYLNSMKDYYKYLETIRDMDEALKNSIPYNTCVYRGVSESFVRTLVKNYDDYYSLVEKYFSETGYLSTSLTFMSSFAKERHHFCIKIYVPKGSEGMDITPFSHNRQEYELLLNSCDLYFIDFYLDESTKHDGIETKVGTKPTFVALLLSKNRECYKDIAVKENNNHTENE